MKSKQRKGCKSVIEIEIEKALNYPQEKVLIMLWTVSEYLSTELKIK